MGLELDIFYDFYVIIEFCGFVDIFSNFLEFLEFRILCGEYFFFFVFQGFENVLVFEGCWI